jgi:hypothetical protein
MAEEERSRGHGGETAVDGGDGGLVGGWRFWMREQGLFRVERILLIVVETALNFDLQAAAKHGRALPPTCISLQTTGRSFQTAGRSFQTAGRSFQKTGRSFQKTGRSSQRSAQRRALFANTGRSFPPARNDAATPQTPQMRVSPAQPIPPSAPATSATPGGCGQLFDGE